MQLFLQTIQKLKLESTRTYFLIFVMVVGVAIRITMNFHHLTSCTWWEQCWSPSQTAVLWGWRGQSRRNWRVNKWPPSTSSWSSPSTGTTSSTSIVGSRYPLIWNHIFARTFYGLVCTPYPRCYIPIFQRNFETRSLFVIHSSKKKNKKRKEHPHKLSKTIKIRMIQQYSMIS